MNVNKVWTPNGYKVGPVNSLVGKGESIIDYTNGTGTLVTKGKVGVDNQPSSVRQDDNNVIAGNDVDWSNGMKFSDQIAPFTAKLQMYNKIENNAKWNKLSSLSKQTQQLQQQQIDKAKAPLLQQMKNITDRQQMQHQLQNNEIQNRYANGKSSSYSYSRTISNGKVPNYWISGARLMPALAETAMLQHWLSNKPQGRDIYSANTYAPQALQELASARVSPYPSISAAKAADRQGMYSINKSGGYSGSQKQNARIAQNLGTERNIANILASTQEKNIGYRNAWAQVALAEGAQDAQRRQAAKQYDWEAYNRAHGARTKGIETHVANLGAMWQKYWADRIKNKQYEDTLNIYQQDVNNRNLALQSLLGGNQGSAGLKVGNASSGNTSTGSKYSILNQYYTPDGLGGYRFSINNPYDYPYGIPASQRVGKFGKMPDFMPTADTRSEKRQLMFLSPALDYPTMTSAQMNPSPSRMMYNSNLLTPTTNDDPNGAVLYNTQQELDADNVITNKLLNASWKNYLYGQPYYNQGITGIRFNNNNDDNEVGYYRRTPIYQYRNILKR